LQRDVGGSQWDVDDPLGLEVASVEGIPHDLVQNAGFNLKDVQERVGQAGDVESVSIDETRNGIRSLSGKPLRVSSVALLGTVKVGSQTAGRALTRSRDAPRGIQSRCRGDASDENSCLGRRCGNSGSIGVDGTTEVSQVFFRQ